MAEPRTYEGSCHCGAVRFEVTTALDPVIACNCSMCGRAGTLLTFAPESAFTLRSGAESLTDYQFGKRRLHHLFCKVCGIKSFSRGTGPAGEDMVAVNARCLEGVDVQQLDVKPFDGRSLPLH